MHDLSDTELAENIRDGCEKSFREIYERYHVQLYYVAKKYVKDPSLAEDAVQDIFVTLWEKRTKIEPSKSLKGFLFTMLKNHVLNMLRDNKETILSWEDIEEGKLPNKNVIYDDLIYREYQELVDRGLNKLSNRKQEVFELKAFSGHTNPEIAKLLKINIRTVKTHYYNSSRFIRTYLKEHAGILVFLFAHSGLAVFIL